MSSLFIDENLPNVLSKKEVYEYFDKLYKGDNKARDILIVHNVRLVLDRVNKRFSNTEYELEDLVSIGILGLMKAVDNFKKSKNNSFSTYAVTCIDNEISTFIRNNKKALPTDSLNKVIMMNNKGDSVIIEDVLPNLNINISLDYERKELNNFLRLQIEKLPNRNREVVKLYFGIGYTQRQLAKFFNVSRTTINNIIKDSLNKIKNALEKYNFIDKPKKKVTFYNYYPIFTKEHIDEVIKNLTEVERSIINLKFVGEEMVLNQDEQLSFHQEYILFNNIIPKVEYLLFSKTMENIKTLKKI